MQTLNIFRFLSGLTILTASLACSTGKAQTTVYQDDALYIRFKQTATPKLPADTRILSIEKVGPLERRQQAYGLHREMLSMRVSGPVLDRTFKLRVDSTDKIEQLLEDLQQEQEIELVERIPVYYLQGTVVSGSIQSLRAGKDGGEQEQADPFYEKDNPSSSSSWHLNMIHAEEAWKLQSGSDKIKVAVVDNAVWGEHPDLQILPENQYNVASGNVGNSAPPSSVQQNAECANANNCVPLNWSHGTHCAGAVGAIRNNGVGIASIGSGVTLMGISCPGSDASGLAVRDAFQGVVWAANHGAKIISLSWGNYSISETERAIIQSCIDKNIIIVAAAGNNGYKDNPMFPANLPGVISVASVDNNKQISSFSNNGEWVCIASPGGKIIQNGQETQGCIFSTTYSISQRYRLGGFSFANGQNYDGMFGTSMATPIVSGLCGLLLSADSTIDPYLMREILVGTAQPLATTAGKNIAPNSGIIDAAAALRLNGVRIPRVRNLSAERQNLDMTLQWEKPQSENTINAYQIFLNNTFIGQVAGDKFSYTHQIDAANSERLYHYGVRALYANGDTSLRTALDITVPVLYTVNVSVQPAGCGTATGAGVYPAGDIRLKATAAAGCTFSRWMEENVVLGRDTILDYTVTTNAEVRAVFSGTPTTNNVFNQTLCVRIYPNPTPGKFTIDMDDDDNLVEIFSIDGVLVDRYEHAGNRLEVILNNTGVYLLRINHNGKTVVKKIMVR